MSLNNIIKSCKNINIYNINKISCCKYQLVNHRNYTSRNNQQEPQQSQQIAKKSYNSYNNSSNSSNSSINTNSNNNNNSNSNNSSIDNNSDSSNNNNNRLIFKGVINENEIENEYKPNLLKLLREEYKLTQIKEISNRMVESLMKCSKRQTKADQEMLLFFGELVLKESTGNPLEFPFPDKDLFDEFESTVKSEYYLRNRCQEIGLAPFIRFSYPTQFKDYYQVYENHYYYRCLVTFIGSLYLDYDFKLANQFIHNVLLDLPNKQVASILLEKPEILMIKKFQLYKLEPPIIKTTEPTPAFPFYTTIIKSGTSQVSKSFGISKDESYNSAIESLNKQSTSLSSLMSHILKNTISFENYNNSNNNSNNNNKNNKYKNQNKPFGNN